MRLTNEAITPYCDKTLSNYLKLLISNREDKYIVPLAIYL